MSARFTYAKSYAHMIVEACPARELRPLHNKNLFIILVLVFLVGLWSLKKAQEKDQVWTFPS